MERIDTIELRNVLPEVFSGSQGDEPVASSQVWCRDTSFTRGNNYLVEAESGTGKSSLCAFVYGNRRDYRGSILFNGQDIRSFSVQRWCEVRRRHLAYLPQEMLLFPELTALENVMVKNRLTDTLTERKIRDMFDVLGIADKAAQPAGRLSVGQQQRVAIVRALAQPFDFILLDEPVSHLDTRNNILVAELIASFASRNNASVISTSVGNPLLIADVTGTEKVKSVML